MNSRHALSSPVSMREIIPHVVKTVSAGAARVSTPQPATMASASSPSASRPSVPTATPAVSSPDYALFIAIDWADTAHELCTWNPATQERTHATLSHTPTALHTWLHDLHSRFPGRRIAVALEQKTGSLINCLMEGEDLDLYLVNPMTVATYRKAFHPSGAKADPSDAELILDLLLQHRDKLTVLTSEDPLTRRLQILTRKRRDVVNLRTTFSNQLTALLKQYYPLFLEVCGEDLSGPMACQMLLAYPCFDALKQADPETLRQFYVRHGCWRPPLIARRLELIREAQPLSTDAALIQSAMLEAKMLATLLLHLGDAIKDYDHTLAELFPQHPDAAIFDSFPGAGTVLAPRLLAAFGTDRRRFASATTVQNMMGISPVKKASGTTMLVPWRKACPKFLRQSFQEYANESIRQSIWARAYYQMQRDRGKGHHAAIRALAFKWIRIMFACWQRRQRYEELTYLNALQRRHAPLLAYLSKSEEVIGTAR